MSVRWGAENTKDSECYLLTFAVRKYKRTTSLTWLAVTSTPWKAATRKRPKSVDSAAETGCVSGAALSQQEALAALRSHNRRR